MRFIGNYEIVLNQKERNKISNGVILKAESKYQLLQFLVEEI